MVLVKLHLHGEYMQIYHSNIQKYQAASSKLREDLKQLSILRLTVFVLSLVIITLLANAREMGAVLIIGPACMLGFGFLVKRYNRLARLIQHTEFLQKVNEQEIQRLDNHLSEFPEGQQFVNHQHPYSSDLDIFGTHSLFQLINRTTTESGSEKLAKWLSNPASRDTILKRQLAIQELVPNLDWRQHLQASGMPFSSTKSDYKKLLDWVEEPEQLLPRQVAYLAPSFALAVGSTLSTIYVLLSDFHIFSVTALVLVLSVNFFLLRRVAPIADETVETTTHNLKVLGGYQALIRKIERENFQSEYLSSLQSIFIAHHYSAANEINSLKKILEAFQLRGSRMKPVGNNGFYLLFNFYWLFDIYLIILTEKWKKRNRSRLKAWATMVSEFEVLNSLAGFTYSNPTAVFPEVKDEPYFIRFETMGHPLLNPQKTVSNNFNLNGQGQIAMITGSNMAGKSTFLRTVGINMVLALSGVPCFARSAEVSNMKLFTSMRTQDNLAGGISSFYAELKRVEQLLRSIAAGEPVLFLLDEMFKGTNSEDRHKGGFSLIRQLSELSAFGIIATHDLELARLAKKHQIAANYSFNSQMQNGEMNFDYKLTSGICTDFNASELMKRSGIKVI